MVSRRIVWKRIAPAALLLLASCGTPPSPDVDDIKGTIRLASFQDYAYYPRPIVEEFAKFNLELKPTEGRILETAVLGTVQWEITGFDRRSDVAIAVRHTADWQNYAFAGDGELINGTANWWGEAQEQHREIQDEVPLNPRPARLLDVFWAAKTPVSGRALLAWHVDGSLNPNDLNTVEAYLVYGCAGGKGSALLRLPATVATGAAPAEKDGPNGG